MTRVFVCSPYAGNVERNTAVAAALCRAATDRGCAAFAPHLLYPKFLDETNPRHRELGILAGLAFLRVCDALWVFIEQGRSRPSTGMEREIALARDLAIPVVINPPPFLRFQCQTPEGLSWINADSAYEERAR